MKEEVKHQFGKSAESYVQSEVHAKGSDLQKLVEIAHLQSFESVLDVATGGGHVANALARLAKKVTAYDLTREMLYEARKFIQGNGYRHVDFVQGDAEDMPFADEEFDLVTCRIAAHHFPHAEKFIQEVHRVLKPGGTFLFIDNVAPEDDTLDQFYNEVEKRRDFSHVRAHKKSEWIRLIEMRGFELEEWHRFPKTILFDPWCDRMKLPEKERELLVKFMLQAFDDARRRFQIHTENRKIISFTIESILLRAKKNVFMR